MSRGRELAKLVVGQSVVVTGVDSDLANTIAALKTRLDSDDAKLQSLGNSLGGNTASLRADLDSDSAVIQTLRTDLASEISSTNTDITAIRARLDSEHENTRSIIAAGLVNLADSDLIVSQLTAKVSSAITRLDSDSIALQNVQTQIDTLKGRLDSDDTKLQALDTALAAEISSTNTDITAIKARLDSEDSKLQALDTAVAAAQARADAAHVRLDSDETIIQGLRNSFTFFEYTATAGQTSFSGSDNNSASLIYTVNQIMVFLNGIRLESSDYTASNGTSVVLTEAAGVSNDVTIVSLVKSS